MIVVQIESPDDGRVSHEVGPFDTDGAAQHWRARFLEEHDFAPDFIAVRDVQFRLWNPADPEAMREIREWYS